MKIQFKSPACRQADEMQKSKFKPKIIILLISFLATGCLLLATDIHAEGCPATDFDCQIA